MPRWKDAEKQIPELSGQRKARETKLFEDHQPLKFAPFSNICSKDDEKTVLTHFFSSNYGLLELGDKEARNMFLTWCLGAKDMTPDQVRNMTVESAAEKFNEFKLREIKKKRKEESEIDMEGEKKEIWLKKIKCVFNKKILIKLKEKNIK